MPMQPQVPSEAPGAPQAGQPPQAQDQPQQQGAGSAQEIVVGINELMSALMAKMEGKADPEDVEQLQSVQAAFQGFVDSMGAPKGAPKGGAVPVEAGGASVKPVV